jgi:hypothetical protein
MYRKFSIGFIIFISAFVLNVSAMSFQLRYERKEEDKENNPFVIEMTDQHVFKFLKNTYFFDLPLNNPEKETTVYFINDDMGFGNQYEVTFKPFLTCQLKFLLINYIGFYSKEKSDRTFYFQTKSGQ